MANIAKLPSGQDLRTSFTGGEYPYGPHMRVLVKDGTVTLVAANDRVVAFTKGAGYSVDIKAIGSGEVTPYVNRFIAGWGKVETYWRTGELRLKAQVSSTAYTSMASSAKVSVPANASVQSVAERTEQRTAPEPVVEPTPIVVATPSVVVATPEVIVEREHDFDPIPTVEPKVKAVRRTIKGTKVVTVGTVTVPERFFDDVEDAWQDRDEDRLAAVLVTGPSGTAKTLFIRAFAAYVGVPFIKVDGGAIRTADDWFGGLKQDPNTKTWAFQYSAFGYALKRGIRCIVLLDEANRSETPQALNAVLGLLDGTKSVYISDAREFLRLPKGMLVAVTANKGAEYVGTVPFDAAVTQRFNYGVTFTYPTEDIETTIVHEVTGLGKDEAGRLVRMANQQRPLRGDLVQFPSGTGISTRMLCYIGSRVVDRGRDIRAAIDSCFEAQFDPEDHTALDVIVDQHFPRSGNTALDVDTTAITEGEA